MMNIPFPRWAGIALIILISACQAVAPAQAEHAKHILVLHAYHKGLTWTDSITQGIEDQLKASGLTMDIEYAFMDTKRVFNQTYLDQLVELYRVKFKDRPFDVIISSDDHAFNFLRQHHKAIFNEAPVVFCGVNYFEDRMLADLPRFTGILESFDILSTLNTALNMQPEAQRIVAIGDQTVTGKVNRKLLEKIIPRLSRKVDVTILDDLSMAEVQARVGRMSTKDIVIWLVFTADSEGHFFSFEESTRLISSYSKAPVYSFWDFNLGHGIVGGMLTSGYMQGQRAAGLALQILRGQPVEDLPVIKESPNQYMFDYRQLERFGFKIAQLPKGSRIINQPVTFYSQYKRLFWTVVAVFIAMSAVILSLLVAVNTRKRAELSLRASSDRYLNVFNSTSVALFETDFSQAKAAVDALRTNDTHELARFLLDHPEKIPALAELILIKDVNPAAVQLFQAPNKEALLKALPAVVATGEMDTYKKILIALSEQQFRIITETSSVSTEGRPMHAILSLNFNPEQTGLNNVIISIFDITDRKKSEEALRRSEDRFRAVFNHAASGMALIDLQGNYWQVNTALCEMIGYSQQELENSTWQAITHPDDVRASMDLIDNVLAGKTNRPIEKRYRHKQGNYVNVLFNLSAICDHDQRPLYFIAQCQDITPIKAAQAALKEREERYRQFFETDLSGVYIATPQGELVMCNEVFARILGFSSRQEVIGTLMTNYYKDPALRPQLLDRILHKQRIEQYELEFKRRDGSTVQCLLNAAGRFDDQGRLIDIQGYLMDITHTKNLEAQLLHAQKMESIGTMAGGVAHDFNNLLMGIVGNASMLMLGKDEQHPDYKRLKTIEALVKGGSNLTQQLLGFAKGGKYEVLPTDLNKLISRSSTMFARTHKEITVLTDLAPDLLPAEVDRSQIDQVLYNLYLNAWQAIENSGRLQIRTRNRDLDDLATAPHSLTAGRYVEIAVTDNGIGMDAAIQQRIFDPFFTTKDRERGTGLGLASAYGIIKNHAGFITVCSKPNQGASFSIFLPASNKATVDEVPEPCTRISGGCETILLVDDEVGVIEAVGSMLNHLGYNVLTASDGRSAIDQFKRHHATIDLVILDMIMPGMGGGEAFDHFKTIDSNAKILLSSGYSVNSRAADIIHRGCEGFIQKPYTIKQLSQKINEAFKRA